MTEQPPAIDTLNLWLETFRVAHEYVFRLHRTLTGIGAESERTRALLTESADVALMQATSLTRRANRLASAWMEQSVLAPLDAAGTVRALETELDRIEPEIRRLRQRHRQIAGELRRLLDSAT